MRRLVIGDIHGGYRAMMQVLDRAEFDKEEDLLIGLGDYVDGWPDSYEVIEFLSTLPNFVGVLGNHDAFFSDYVRTGVAKDIWVSQGGRATFESYKNKTDMPPSLDHPHIRFLSGLPLRIVLEDKKLFVHGGVHIGKEGISTGQSDHDLLWDRTVFTKVANYLTYRDRPKYGHPQNLDLYPYKELYFGHTTTQLLRPDFTPVVELGIHMLDQGAGWDGKLTVMDIDTKDYWQSDFVPSLYPEEKGRG